MIRLLVPFISCSVLAIACSAHEVEPSQDITPVVSFEPAAILAIADELSVHDGMNSLCEGESANLFDPFLSELRSFMPSDALLADVDRVHSEVIETVTSEEPEYVCTPEMFEDAASRVAQVKQAWGELKAGVE